ncbi:MAG: type I DNA topoisomerase [Candidatus Omnitrophota bacterium]
MAKKKIGGRKKQKKQKFLVIVESPAKSKTINKILGRDYKVMASMGHIVDLPASRMGIDFDNDFSPEYIVMRGRSKYLTAIKKEAAPCQAVYLAADPDREGEAICWHIKNQLEKKLDSVDFLRVSFDEITAKAVKEAFSSPRELDMSKINAQQARRILDRIVGYLISPLLWGKVTRGLSAGRVQSVAVRLIVDREEAIKNFTSKEYWSIEALLKKKDNDVNSGEFTSKLTKYRGEKVHIKDVREAERMISDLEKERYVVKDVFRKEKKSHPRSPYTTSILQQEAFNKINFPASKTMRVAQRLYEGVEIGAEGSVGLITYMRTDSVRIADDASTEARKFISEKYGDNYLPEKIPVYKSGKRSQEAHEAIRPTLPLREPEQVASFLSEDEAKLYTLIWNRFLASQMTNALYSVLAVGIKAGEYDLHSGGAKLIFDGHLRVYGGNIAEEGGINKIPDLVKGEEVDLVKLVPGQHFTKPLPRYTDASLVKELEEKGIGRPSTYAPIIRTITDRHYIKRLQKSLAPTELGVLVNGLLVDNFPEVVDPEFTAKMENELDGIEDGREDWKKVLRDFYGPFSRTVEEAKSKMSDMKKEVEATDEVCSLCGRPMVIKWGRRGRFISCSGFPECRNSKSITTGVKCPETECDGELVERKSRRGAFYGCSNFPRCTYTSRKLPSGDSEGPGDEGKVEEG